MIVVLLALIFCLLLILVVSQLGSFKNENTSPVHDGQVVKRSELSNPPTHPEKIGKTDRIKEVAQAGKTYEIVLKGGVEARVEDKDWGVKQVVNLGFMFEAVVERTIESNDGNKIVELRCFESVKMAKTLCEVEAVTIELGKPGVAVLAGLDYFYPRRGYHSGCRQAVGRDYDDRRSRRDCKEPRHQGDHRSGFAVRQDDSYNLR